MKVRRNPRAFWTMGTLDMVVPPLDVGKIKGCLATFVERKSRLYTAIKIPDRSVVSMEAAITLLSSAFKTATIDRGKEVACHEVLQEKLGIAFYFTDHYCFGNLEAMKMRMDFRGSFVLRTLIRP